MANDKLNILFLASWYPNTESTQAGNFIQQHAKAVAAYVNVAVIHVVAKANISKEEISIKSDNGIFEVIVYHPKVTSSTPILSLKEKKKRHHNAYLKAYEIAKKEFGKFNLVHLNVVYPAGLFALHLKQKHNIPYILTEHWTAFLESTDSNFNTIEKHFIKKIANNANIICPVSENLKHNIERFGIKNQFQVIPNVVDTNIFKFQPKAIKEVKEILHISNLKDEHKNITGILNVIKKLSSERNDFRLTIAGNGDTNKFITKAAEMGIDEQSIHFEGEKTPTEVAQLMQQSDLFLLFSNYENLPCVIAESLVMGRPVISTNVGGINEMLNDTNGKLITSGNEDMLLQELNKLLNSLTNYNPEEISTAAQQVYSKENIANAFLKIYHSSIN